MDEIKVTAGKLVSTLKALVREGNVRRIVIRNAEGRTLLDMPLTAEKVWRALTLSRSASRLAAE